MVEGTCRGRPSSSPLLISKCGQPRRMHVSMSCLCVFFPLWFRTDLSCLVWFMFCRCCPLFTLPVYVLFFVFLLSRLPKDLRWWTRSTCWRTKRLETWVYYVQLIQSMVLLKGNRSGRKENRDEKTESLWFSEKKSLWTDFSCHSTIKKKT